MRTPIFQGDSLATKDLELPRLLSGFGIVVEALVVFVPSFCAGALAPFTANVLLEPPRLAAGFGIRHGASFATNDLELPRLSSGFGIVVEAVSCLVSSCAGETTVVDADVFFERRDDLILRE